MTLIIFKYIRSDFHPEAGTYFCGNKFHQLHYFIRMLNDKSKIIFVLGDHCAFDEVIISTRSRYCAVKMYKKDKPDKYRVDYFISTDSRNYFIYNIYLYQDINT